jgi:hypothetical protein
MNLLRNFVRNAVQGGGRIGLVASIALFGLARAERLNWFSDPNRTNLTSTGQLMDGAFRFELGVFTGGFVPTSGNTSQWAAHWTAAERIPYNASSKRISSIFTVTDNDAPFSVGANAYVWGFKGSEASGEWILFRKSTWIWPSPNPFNPFTVDWSVAQANVVVLGNVNASGSPSLMQSAAVSNSAPPDTSWSQWQDEELAGVSLNGPNDDADGDGISNLIEFVFGTLPKTANTPVATPSSFLELSGQRYLQISIPRRRDHPATLVVEVSSDLAIWNSGASHTQVVSDDASALVVRDLTPIGPASPKRFMRLRAITPAP